MADPVLLAHAGVNTHRREGILNKQLVQGIGSFRSLDKYNYLVELQSV